MHRSDQFNSAILVTGGAGLIGRHLVEALIQTSPGHTIRVLDIQRHGNSPPAVEFFSGSVEDTVAVDEAMRGARIVVHLAAKVDPDSKDVAALRRVNVDGTRNVFGLAVKEGCELFLHLSSAGVYGPPRRAQPFQEIDELMPRTPYQRSKCESEQVFGSMDRGNTSVVILRPAGVYGPGSYLELPVYRRIQRQRFSVELPGGVIVHPTFVADVVQAVLAVLNVPPPHGSIFNIGGERALRIEELYALLARTLGVRRRRLVIPRAAATVGALAATAVLSRLGKPRPSLREMARGAEFSAAVDDRVFRTTYPSVPTVSLEAGVEEHVSWARTSGLLE